MSTAYSTSPQIINLSFSGHQTFPFRYTWLKKGVDAVREDATIFSSENASVTLGAGKNMVASIRHWCSVAGLIKADSHERGRFVFTPLGRDIFNDDNGFDPYLDDPATLWLIHWKITTNMNQQPCGIGHLTFSERINSHLTYLKNNCPNGHDNRNQLCVLSLKRHFNGISVALSEPIVSHGTPLQSLRRVLTVHLLNLI